MTRRMFWPALALAAIGCAGTPYELLIYTGSSSLMTLNDSSGEGVVHSEALGDLACPSSQLRVSPPHDCYGATVFFVAGCGHHASYVSVTFDGLLASLPALHHDGPVRLYVQRFVRVTDHVPADVAQFEHDVGALQSPSSPRPLGSGFQTHGLREHYDLGVAASRELGCAFDDLALDVTTRRGSVVTYLVEGCGARATFVRNASGALVMASRVDATP